MATAKKSAPKKTKKPATKTAKKSPAKTAKKSAAKSKTTSGKLSTAAKKKLPASSYAFPEERKEPLENASHVRNAISRFNQVKDVSDAQRDAAWKRIKAAAKKFDVEVNEKSWRDIGKD